MIYLGIDPGQTGAMARIVEGESDVWDFDTGDPLWIIQSIAYGTDPVVAVLEKVSAQ